jgi:DNA-binding NarL/FixJ family response regulator
MTILVASDYKPLINLLERAMQGEAVVYRVEPTSTDLLKAVAERPDAVVVLHERQGEEAWLHLAHALREADRGTKVVVFGETSDVGIVARGIVHGVANYVPWKFGASPQEVRQAIMNSLGDHAPKDGVYFRVKSMLPCNQQGVHVLASGRGLLTDDAIQQCLSLGLTAKETASHLGVSESQVERVGGQSRLKPKEGAGFGAGRLKIAGGVLLAGLALLIMLNLKREKVFVPVSGTLTVSGQPLRDVIVHFSREGGSHIASGKTDATGKYRLSTLRQGDGAEEGIHVVWVGVPYKISDHIEMTDPQYTQKMIALLEKSQAEQESKTKDDDEVVPASYRDMKLSPLRAEIKGRRPVVLDFDLVK